ncbi:bifunctional UDP-N-acetylglucosamine diphosphorylase/glucosamine-1-phosphate N-acetyltransferase GlmU [Algihabitans albus]|uniref:bifunctional UDP-N-acetylglucosamine diphosphorylase/glucosamine-1-phosphate N-acetyltransferase GlmU n=1 Tax=Algihabitans albus TaxID=2164067 RepID=UPI000E5D4155|nr:bifunctional UDP-N-acetylglucosamine diphosphorylase/glucosamine-1-phosphate N-acetyltransferase GlmU [Algihabitans albus]
MTSNRLAVVVLAAGMGTRMKSGQPKVLHQVAGKPLLRWVLEAAEELDPERIVVVVGPGMESAVAAAKPHAAVIQEDRLGTAHAVQQALPLLIDDQGSRGEGDILVLYGDTPFISPKTLKAMLELHRAPKGGTLVALGFEPTDATGYGRLQLDDQGALLQVCEQAEIDADPDKAALGEIRLCNAGVVLADGPALFDLLAGIDNDNAKGEFYLTDIYALARQRSQRTAVQVASEEEVMGINDRCELAEAERIAQQHLRRRAMRAGATLIGAETIFLCDDTQLGRDSVIHPHVVFGPGVIVGERCEIKSFSHLEGCRLAANAVIGPFARLRPGTELGEGARIGNFVEVKNARLGAGAKANHLTYLGDATVGEEANIGAGTITCNYDGFGKHRTEIGARAFIGSNSALVAPVKVGADAIVGAGSTIVEDVPDQSLAVTRGAQRKIEDGAKRFRERRSKKE